MTVGELKTALVDVPDDMDVEVLIPSVKRNLNFLKDVTTVRTKVADSFIILNVTDFSKIQTEGVKHEEDTSVA